MRDADKPGWVYFIVSDDQDAVKIGFAVDVEGRRLILQTGNPSELHIMDMVRGTPRLERALKTKFKHLRIRLEWFRLDDEILGFLEELEGLRRQRVSRLFARDPSAFPTVDSIIDAIEEAQLPIREILALEAEPI